MTPRPAWRPTPAQEILLDVCLLSPERARAAWLDAHPCADVSRIDGGSYRLLPLLWRRLSELDIDAPVRGTLKGVYRRTWYQNQLLLAWAAGLVTVLAEAGIPAMLVKGAALTLLHYRDEGARPMQDVDLAVPRADARRAVERLARLGWRAGITPLMGGGATANPDGPAWSQRPRPIERFDDAYFGVRHGHGFIGPHGEEIDLHWHVFQGQCTPGADDDLWAGARPVRLKDATVVVPDAADHLLLVLAHAARWNPVPPVRWIADAATLVRTADPAVRWDRLVDAAERRRLTLPAGEMLEYLRARFDVNVPEHVTGELLRAPFGRRDRRDYRVHVSPPGLATGLAEMQYLFGRYRNLRRAAPPQDGLPAFPRFLAETLGADHLGQVAAYAMSQAVRRLAGGRSGGSPYRNLPVQGA